VSRMVTTAQTLGADWVISAGLESGERVIVEGLQKVRPGAQVVAQEAGAAPAAASSN
jgi:membrane fusion protein, multidrug efflux system